MLCTKALLIIAEYVLPKNVKWAVQNFLTFSGTITTFDFMRIIIPNELLTNACVQLMIK